MNSDDLCQHYPYVFHMADPRSWNGILQHGLLSTTALLDLYEVDPKERDSIEGARRPKIVAIEHPEHGTAYIRDNKPLSEARLANALDPGTSVEDFLRLLNRHVFFWLTEKRLNTLLGARAYRGREHLVLTVETKELVNRYDDCVVLSSINSGSTVYRAVPRGLDTFQKIENYNFSERRKARGIAEAIAELAVEYAVPDILNFTVQGAIHHPDGKVEVVYDQ